MTPLALLFPPPYQLGLKQALGELFQGLQLSEFLACGRSVLSQRLGARNVGSCRGSWELEWSIQWGGDGV